MSRKLTSLEFQNRIVEKYGNQFTVLSEYINNQTKIKLQCNKCGSIIYKTPSKMMGSNNEGCYICSGKNHYKTSQSLQNELNVKYPNKFLIIGDYVRARQPLKVKNLDCGHEYDMSPDNLLRGKGCPKCSIKQSHYMDKVEMILNNIGIMYVKEKRFADCKNQRTLPFDYYIPSLNVCIEVAGEFHYSNNSVFKNNKHSRYEAIHYRDNIKNEYCIKHNIKLIRLPYFKENDFGNILKQELQVDTEVTI